MNITTIRNNNDKSILYQGKHSTHTQALEYALQCGTDLKNADLRNLNLTNANLDGADFSGAWLDNTDLTGANLSEANLTGASMRGTDLTLATLCEATLSGTDFTDASFAATLITGARIDNCPFTCPSSLTLPFHEAYLGQNRYQTYIFTQAPVIVTGLPKRIVFLDDVVLIGHEAFPRPDFPNPFEPLFKSPSIKNTAAARMSD